jgi:hypothetical protein
MPDWVAAKMARLECIRAAKAALEAEAKAPLLTCLWDFGPPIT